MPQYPWAGSTCRQVTDCPERLSFRRTPTTTTTLHPPPLARFAWSGATRQSTTLRRERYHCGGVGGTVRHLVAGLFSSSHTQRFIPEGALSLPMKEVRMVNGEVVDPASFCETCGQSLVTEWSFCPECGDPT